MPKSAFRPQMHVPWFSLQTVPGMGRVAGIFKLFFQVNLQAALSLEECNRQIIYILGVRKGWIAGRGAGAE